MEAEREINLASNPFFNFSLDAFVLLTFFS